MAEEILPSAAERAAGLSGLEKLGAVAAIRGATGL
jgi:hypothetical protein